jgi:hypothetical protein
VLRRNIDLYDFIPVVTDANETYKHIIGLFHAANYADHESNGDLIRDKFNSLSEEFIIGADASILDFIKEADAKPCRLVVSGGHFIGLVSLSDLEQLPVRAVLFALITGFEITMLEAIKRIYESELDWKNALSPERRENVEHQKRKSVEADSMVETLLFTQFVDKKTLIMKKLPSTRSRTAFERSLKLIEALRNKIAHASDYANTCPCRHRPRRSPRCHRDRQRSTCIAHLRRRAGAAESGTVLQMSDLFRAANPCRSG